MKMCKAGDILISVRAPVGAINIADRDYCIGRGLAAVRIEGMTSRLAAHVISAAAPALRRVAQGTTFEAINKADLASLMVKAPTSKDRAPLSQFLDTLDTTIRQTEAIIEKLKQVKQGLLHDLLTRGIDANGELRPPQSEAPHLYKASPLGWIPHAWQILPAEQVCEAVIDCKNRTPPEATSGHPVIRTPNVRDGRFVRQGLAFTDSLSYAIWTQRGRPSRGDVLITREAPVGEVCLLPDDMTDACLGQRMMMYRPDADVLKSEFMLIALLSDPVQKSLLDLAGGSTVGHVKVGDIRKLRIPIPSLHEQAQIIEAYAAMDVRLSSEEALIAKLRQNKSGLMDDLLTGRVRVTPLLQGQAA
jgi:type I restriction enzyme S subunit